MNISREAFPFATIQLQAAGEQLLIAFAAHMKDIEAAADQAVTAAIESFDWRSELWQVAAESLRAEMKRATQRFFEYGGPGQKFIDEQIYKMWTAIYEKREIPVREEG